MRTLPRVLKNSVFLTFGRVISLLSSLAVYALVGRMIGPEGLGQFSFILTYTGAFIFLSSLGVHLYITREISRQKGQVLYYLGQSLTLVFLLIPITIGILALGPKLLFTVEPNTQVGILLAGIHLALGTLILIFYAAFQAFEHMELEMLSVMTENLIAILLVWLILLRGGDVLGLILGLIISRIISFALCILLFTKNITPLSQISLSLESAKEIINKSIPFSINILTTTVYVQVDLILLNLWKGDEASGYYKAATSLVIPLSILATSFNRALFPNMARSFLNSISKLTYQVEISIRYLFLLGWPIAIGISLLAPQVIAIVYGYDFEASVLILQILVFIVPMRYINNTMGATLTATNRQGLRSMIIFVCGLVNLVLNVIMIPTWSYIGATISTVITEIIITIALIFSLRKLLPWPRVLEITWRSLLAGLVMGIVIFWFRSFNVLLIVPLGVLIYCLALYIFKAIPKEDLGVLKNTLKTLTQKYRLLWSKP